jgi:hypothetical protein
MRIYATPTPAIYFKLILESTNGARGMTKIERSLRSVEYEIWDLEFSIWNLESGIWNSNTVVQLVPIA